MELIFDKLDDALKNDALAQADKDLCDSDPDSSPSCFQLPQGDSSRVAPFSCDYSAKCTTVLEKLVPLAQNGKESFREFRET